MFVINKFQILQMFQQAPREELSEKSRSTKNSGLTQRKEKSIRFLIKPKKSYLEHRLEHHFEYAS